jgi:hypothetical protein
MAPTAPTEAALSAAFAACPYGPEINVSDDVKVMAHGVGVEAYVGLLALGYVCETKLVTMATINALKAPKEGEVHSDPRSDPLDPEKTAGWAQLAKTVAAVYAKHPVGGRFPSTLQARAGLLQGELRRPRLMWKPLLGEKHFAGLGSWASVGSTRGRSGGPSASLSCPLAMAVSAQEGALTEQLMELKGRAREYRKQAGIKVATPVEPVVELPPEGFYDVAEGQAKFKMYHRMVMQSAALGTEKNMFQSKTEIKKGFYPHKRAAQVSRFVMSLDAHESKTEHKLEIKQDGEGKLAAVESDDVIESKVSSLIDALYMKLTSIAFVAIHFPISEALKAVPREGMGMYAVRGVKELEGQELEATMDSVQPYHLALNAARTGKGSHRELVQVVKDLEGVLVRLTTPGEGRHTVGKALAVAFNDFEKELKRWARSEPAPGPKQQEGSKTPEAKQAKQQTEQERRMQRERSAAGRARKQLSQQDWGASWAERQQGWQGGGGQETWGGEPAAKKAKVPPPKTPSAGKTAKK